jgi:hypothetical protein
MQLFYRGIAYEVQNPQIEVTETNRVGTFLGSSFKIKQANLAQRHTDSRQLTYRGAHYQQ